MVHVSDGRRKAQSIGPFHRQLGYAISHARRTRDIKQEVLAEEAGIQRPYLSKIEGGRVDVSIEVVHRIAKALGLTLSELLKDLG